MEAAHRELCERIRAGIEAMPLNRLLGIAVPRAGGGRARAELPLSPAIANHVGGVHSAAQYALVEAACGAAATSAFVDLLGRVLPLAQRVEVRYAQPAVTEIAAEATVDPDEAERARELVASGRDAGFSVVCEVTDGGGTVVCSAVMRWVLRPL